MKILKLLFIMMALIATNEIHAQSFKIVSYENYSTNNYGYIQKEKALYLGSLIKLEFYGNNVKMRVEANDETIILNKKGNNKYQTTDEIGNKLVLNLSSSVKYITSGVLRIYSSDNKIRLKVTFERLHFR